MRTPATSECDAFCMNYAKIPSLRGFTTQNLQNRDFSCACFFESPSGTYPPDEVNRMNVKDSFGNPSHVYEGDGIDEITGVVPSKWAVVHLECFKVVRVSAHLFAYTC